MPYNPLGEAAQPDLVLTQISLGYPNNGMVGNVLLPQVVVRKQSDIYYKFGRESWLPEDDIRAPGTPAVEIPGISVATDPYFTREYALSHAIPDEERENVESPLAPDRDGVELVTSKIMMRRELRIHDLVTTAANYHTGHTVTLAGTSQWSDYLNSTPIADMKAALRQVHSALFVEPNLAVIPYEVMAILEDHPDFIERIKYSAAGIITADIIAAVVGIERIVVPGLGYDASGNPGTAASITYMWGKDVVFAWVPPRAGLRLPSFGYEFVWGFPGAGAQAVDRWREEKRKADLVRVARRYDLKLIAVDEGTSGSIAGYLIKDAVA